METMEDVVAVLDDMSQTVTPTRSTARLQIVSKRLVKRGARAEERWWTEYAARVGTRLGLLGVRPVHRSATLADFPWRIYRQTLTFLRARCGGAVISGPPGTGKSYLAAAMTRYAVLRGDRARFILARRLFRELWDSFSDRSLRSHSEVLDGFVSVDFLVIDDLGPGREGRVSDASLGALHEILTTRLDYGRPTVVTTNFGLSAIERDYDVSIKSRLAGCEQIVLGGSDRRIFYPRLG